MESTQSLKLCVASHLFANFLRNNSTNSINLKMKISSSGNLKRHFLSGNYLSLFLIIENAFLLQGFSQTLCPFYVATVEEF